MHMIRNETFLQDAKDASCVVMGPTSNFGTESPVLMEVNIQMTFTT